MAAIDIEVKGLKETQRKMEQMARDVHGTPMVDAIRDSALMVLRGVKQNYTAYQSAEVGGVDSGVTRASFTPVIRATTTEITGVVGSNRMTAVWQEFGTRPHWPPIAALETWARRHGTSAFLVARKISKKGTAARKQLTRAFEDNKSRIFNRFERALKEIVEKKA